MSTEISVQKSALSRLAIARGADDISKSEIRGMSVACERVGGVNLAQGVCDTELPELVAKGAEEGIRKGFNSYTRHDGLARLRSAIARKCRRDNGLAVDPETQIVVSAGSTGAFYCACLALLNPGDEVILFEPFYGYHLNTLKAARAVPVTVPLSPPDWRFSLEELERVVTPRTRGIMINTPSNPSGKVFTRVELELLGDFAERHDLFIFTDEIYEYILYDGRTHITPASLPGMAERTIAISGFSKTFSITGWRIGYSISDARWATAIGCVNDLVYVCAPAPLQYGVAEGLDRLETSFYTDLAVAYAARRDALCKTLERIGLPPLVPQGAYYVLADARRIEGATSLEKAMRLLERTGVAGVPGEAFFNEGRGDHLIRFCFAKSKEDLEEACRRLELLR